jgi:hypothetical protein
MSGTTRTTATAARKTPAGRTNPNSRLTIASIAKALQKANINYSQTGYVNINSQKWPISSLVKLLANVHEKVPFNGTLPANFKEACYFLRECRNATDKGTYVNNILCALVFAFEQHGPQQEVKLSTETWAFIQASQPLREERPVALITAPAATNPFAPLLPAAPAQVRHTVASSSAQHVPGATYGPVSSLMGGGLGSAPVQVPASAPEQVPVRSSASAPAPSSAMVSAPVRASDQEYPPLSTNTIPGNEESWATKCAYQAQLDAMTARLAAMAEKLAEAEAKETAAVIASAKAVRLSAIKAAAIKATEERVLARVPSVRVFNYRWANASDDE